MTDLTRRGRPGCAASCTRKRLRLRAACWEVTDWPVGLRSCAVCPNTAGGVNESLSLSRRLDNANPASVTHAAGLASIEGQGPGSTGKRVDDSQNSQLSLCTQAADCAV